MQFNDNKYCLFSDLNRIEFRSVARQLTEEASQEDKGSTISLDNLLDRIGPINFAERIRTEADAILFATTVGLSLKRE